jgi:hypothetical protein
LYQSQPLRPTELFKYPFVVEVMGAGFDRSANARHFALRFPRVQKIHDDRTYRDTVSFNKLQDMARKVADPLQEDEDSQAKLALHERPFEHVVQGDEVRRGGPEAVWLYVQGAGRGEQHVLLRCSVLCRRDRAVRQL